jgi:hypothetical protein
MLQIATESVSGLIPQHDRPRLRRDRDVVLTRKTRGEKPYPASARSALLWRIRSVSAAGGLRRVCVFAIAFLFFTEDHPAFRKVRL